MNTNITAKDIVYNYQYKKNMYGGGLLDNVSIKKFTQGLVSNRVLDIYLKYIGITTLTTTTLVPLALVMGNTYFEDAVNYIKKSDQSGGKFLDNKIPVIDDELIGNYLKLSGLSVLNVSPYTLIPLGILMTIYNMYEKENNLVGGNVTPLPSQYFNPNLDCQSQEGSGRNLVGGNVTPLPSQYFNPNLDCQSQEGSGRNLLGESIPPNFLQNINNFVTGRPIPEPSRIFPYENNSMQLREPNVSTKQYGGSSDWISSQMSRGAYNSPGQDINQFRMFTKMGDYISNASLSNQTPNNPVQAENTHVPLFNQDIGNVSNGVTTKQFGGYI